MKLWKQIQAQAKSTKAPALLFQEAELPLRVTRDLFTGDFERALVDDDKTLKRIQGYLKKTSPHMAERVSRYRDKPALFEAYGVDAEIRSTLSRRVDLPSGGYLIFDYAEAFTVIDVNTGRFVGSRSKSSTQRLEDTVTKNNLEAVKEVVRQLRLRDIGGIIVIDFIDMANPKNRETVEQALQQELERDRTKTYVVEISPLGLVEMTRQNVTDGPREILTRKCPTCAGEGVVVSEATAVVDAERKLRALAASKPRTKAFKVELNDHVAGLLVGSGAARLEEIEAQAKRRFFVVGKAGVGHDHFAVLDEGTVEKLAVTDAPVREGQTLEVKLVEVGRFDVGAGMAKLDGGYLISVAGGAKLVGKKVNVRIARVLDGTAYAVLADAAPAATSTPITAEAQAEKPTRASRAKKPEAEAEPEVVEGELVAEAEEPVAEEKEPVAEEGQVVGEEADAEEPAAGTPPKPKTRRGSRGGRGRKKKPAAEQGQTPEGSVPEVTPEREKPAEEAPPKKKTRRGSRGGRGRKKPAAATAAAETNGAGAPEAETAEPRRPTIHVPEAEAPSTNGDEPGAAPARKRTRRGSRGGRRHRKPTTAAAEQQPSDES
jgi:ribonuclease G